MVVLAASVISKNGRVLVSRQYMEMNRIRVEGLLAAFPKLVGTGKQHTYVETENVRYVYQPMEGMYLLLITNKQSNILEDIETLRLLSKVVPEYVPELEEAAVCEGAFDLLFAFDEVIALGHKEEVTVAQVRQNTEMHSNEEELHNMIYQSKVDEANEVMKRKAGEIDRLKLDQGKSGGTGAAPWRSMALGGGISSGSADAGAAMDELLSIAPTLGTSSLLGKPASARTGPSKGMKLSKDKKNDILSALAREGEAVDTGSVGLTPPRGASAASAAKPPRSEPVSVSIEEKLTVRMNKEGGVEQMEVQGALTLLCTDEAHAHLLLELRMGRNTGMQFKTHPFIDKALYASQQRLGVKDAVRPFPINTPQGILIWRYQTTEAERVPLSINCWPTASGDSTYINIEYESAATYDLQNVVIRIPGIFSPPKVTSIDGDWRYSTSDSCLEWAIELIDDSNRTGSMEAVVNAGALDSFFPCTVAFTAPETLCDLHVPQCLNRQSNAPEKFAFTKALTTARFEVVY